MSNESRKKIKKDPETGFGIDSKQPNQSRRSFAKAGIIAPVIMSLANRPAWGDVTHRCNVSGWASVPNDLQGSGIPPHFDSCGFASASDVFKALPSQDRNKQINSKFSCYPVAAPPETIGQALEGDFGPWIQYMMTARLSSNNPFNCPVEDVEDIFCQFEGGADRVNFGNVSLKQHEVQQFLETVIPPPGTFDT